MVQKLSTGTMVVAAGKVVAALAICTLSGVAWAGASVVGGAAADGYPPEYYDAGNRFAFSVALMFLIMICAATSLFAYGLARGADWSIWRSLGIAHLGARGNLCGCRTRWPSTREAGPAARRAVTDRFRSACRPVSGPDADRVGGLAR